MRVAVACCVGAVLCGCAHTPDGASEPEKAPLAPFGIARIDTRTDVVTVLAHLDHVLYPNNTVAEPPMDKPAPQPVALSSPVSTTPPVVMPINAPAPPDAPVALALPQPTEQALITASDSASMAWLKLCYGEELNPQEWAVIDSTPRPAELDQVWDEKCVPIK